MVHDEFYAKFDELDLKFNLEQLMKVATSSPTNHPHAEAFQEIM